jgi:hypothetical protein
MVAIDARAPLYDGGIVHPHRLRVAGHHGQPRRPALLRRGRGLLAQALRHLGPAGGAAAGADGLQHHRRQGHGPLHAAGVQGRAQADSAARTGAQLGLDEAAFMHHGRLQRRLPRRHLRPHGAGRLPHRRPDARPRRTGRGPSTPRRSTATRSSPASPSPTWA